MKKLRTALIGAGKMGASYADDPKLARCYRYISHAQVLAEHPAFEWHAVVDRSADAARAAAERYGVPVWTESAKAIPGREQIEVAVIATPVDARADILADLPGLRAVLVEKPLGRTFEESASFLDACAARGLVVQVNLWRRADQALRDLAAGGLRQAAGDVQAVFGIYGNGLLNSGSHMIDLVRMLAGEPVRVHAAGEPRTGPHLPISDDVDIPFVLELESGAVVHFAPVDFRHYRENGLDIWGTRGRVSLLLEGLLNVRYVAGESRSTSGAREVSSDTGEAFASTAGTALYAMHDNLAAAVRREQALFSTGESAIRNERIIDAILKSAADDGRRIAV